MIQPKAKACKGKDKASDFTGCGEKKQIHKFGLCIDCFKTWLYNSDSGLSYLKKVSLNASKQVKKEQLKEHNLHLKQTRERKVDLMSTDEYRSKYVQPLINEIARLIDYQQPCIASGCFGKQNAGHYHATGANRTITLHLDNLHSQSFESNHHKSGDNVRYREGLIRTYGRLYYEKVESLSQIKPIKLTKDDLREVKRIASEIIKELKADLKVRTPDERIKLREYYNQKLSIYENDH